MLSRAGQPTGAGEQERKRWEDRQVQAVYHNSTDTERCLRFKGSNQIFPGIVGESSEWFILTKPSQWPSLAVGANITDQETVETQFLLKYKSGNSIQFVSTELASTKPML